MSATEGLPVLAELPVQQQKATVRRLGFTPSSECRILRNFASSLGGKFLRAEPFHVFAQGPQHCLLLFPHVIVRTWAAGAFSPFAGLPEEGVGPRGSRRAGDGARAVRALRLAAPARPMAAASPSSSQVGWSRAPDWTEDRKNAPRYVVCANGSRADNCPLNGSDLDAGQAWIHGCRQLDFHRPILASEVAIAPRGRIA
jgi:hypothetical protein